MADHFPPDSDNRAGQRGAEKSGEVADFRYRSSPQPKKVKESPAHSPVRAKGRSRRSGKSAKSNPKSNPKADKAAKPNFTASSGSGNGAGNDTASKKANRKAGRNGPRNDLRNGPRTNARSTSKTGAAPPSPPSTKPRPSFHTPQNGKYQRQQAYAALDLGTNNCRLLIARPEGEDFTVVDAFSRVVRLGEGLAKTGRLSDEAMDRTLAALKVCAEKLRRRNVRLARSVATEACRRATNGASFIERVQRETGIVFDIISAQEEARLAVLGCHILLEEGEGPAVIFDIGGGSTELILIEPEGKIPRILDWQSVPWGVVSLTDTVGGTEHSSAERLARYTEMRRLVSESFAAFAKRIAIRSKGASDIRLLGTSGTVTTLASLHLELPHYDRRQIDGLIVPSSAMRNISRRLSTMSPQERGSLPCIGNDRANLVVAGCAILEAIMDIWPASRLGVADRGIREGILRSMMAADLQGTERMQELRDGI